MKNILLLFVSVIFFVNKKNYSRNDSIKPILICVFINEYKCVKPHNRFVYSVAAMLYTVHDTHSGQSIIMSDVDGRNSMYD